MARSAKIRPKRQIDPDPLYGNKLLTRFVNRIMHNGKKSTALDQVYKALTLLKEKGHDPIKVFEQAINNVGPRMEVKPRRVGGASYQVPVEVRGDRRVSLAIRWIAEAAKKRSSKDYKSYAEKLAAEIVDILAGQGEAVRKRDAVHRVADSNRAFSHFRW